MIASPETSEKPSPAVDQIAPRSHGRKWVRRLLVAVLVIGCLYLSRGPILRQVGGFLVIDESPAAGSAVLVFDERAVLYDEAGRLYAVGGAPQVLFFRLPARRAEVVGARPRGNVTGRQQLEKLGIPKTILMELSADGRRAWDRTIALGAWLAEHREVNVLVLCERFESRGVRTILDRILDRPDAGRVRVQGVVDPRYDENNWWQRKEGTVDLFDGYARLTYVWVNGDSGEIRPDLSPDAYEEAIGTAK